MDAGGWLKAASWLRFSALAANVVANLGVEDRGGAEDVGRAYWAFREVASANSDLYLLREAEREDMAGV